MTREDLLKSKEYWMVQIQNDLFGAVDNYMQKYGLNRTMLAADIGVSKGYISQIFNGDFDHKLSKVVELALASDTVPIINFLDIEQFIKEDLNGKRFQLVPMLAPAAITYAEAETVSEQFADGKTKVPKQTTAPQISWEQSSRPVYETNLS